MGLIIYPEFELNLPSMKVGSSGEFLARNFEELDKIALSAGLTPFTAFADTRPIPEDFEGDPDELSEVMG